MKQSGRPSWTRTPAYVSVLCLVYAALTSVAAYGVHLAAQPALAGVDRIALLAGAAGFGLLPLLVLAAAMGKGLGYDLNRSPQVSRGIGIALKYVPAAGGLAMLLRHHSPAVDSPPASYMLNGGIVLSLVAGIGFLITRLDGGGWH